MKGCISKALMQIGSSSMIRKAPAIRSLSSFSSRYANQEKEDNQADKSSKTSEFHNVGASSSSKKLKGNPDLTTLLTPAFRSKVIRNLVDRLYVKSEESAEEMLDSLYELKNTALKEPFSENRDKLNEAALQFPNFSHPAIIGLKEPRTLFDNCDQLDQKHLKKIRSFDEINRIMNGSRTEHTGQTTTEKSYFLLGPFAELEQALINYTIDHLTTRAGFELVSVPDILNPEIIEACGLKTTGRITNVFKLDPRFYENKALSGTAEMGFGSLFANKKISFKDSNVKKFAAVSRCYRAESTMGKKEKGLYRVHHFTKVEMFALTISDQKVSDMVHEQMLQIQQRLFDDLDIHYRVLDMHPGDLGAPATRKFDCEALLPGNNSGAKNDEFYGEISSTSNCLDFQSRRLNIRDSESGKFCHTVNGTACAVPRMIMTFCEQNQLDNGCVNLPRKLWPYMPSMKDSRDDFLGPRPKNKRPVFQYKASPKAFLS